MTNISSTSGGSAAYYAMQKDMFNKLDSDKDGSLSQTEFVSARPKNVTEDQASKLYAKMDTEDTGAVSLDQFATNGPGAGPAGRMSGDAMAVVMGLGQAGGMMPPHGGHDGKPDIAEMYTSMDSDGDGSVTKDEFIGSRPDDVNEDQANALYASIDTKGTGSITEDQLAESMKRGHGGPPMGLPPAEMTSMTPMADDMVVSV